MQPSTTNLHKLFKYILGMSQLAARAVNISLVIAIALTTMLGQEPVSTPIPVNEDPEYTRQKLALISPTSELINEITKSAELGKYSSSFPSAQFVANAVRFLPGCTANTLAGNDDGSTGLIALPFTINYFGANYSNTFVNNNGNITFTGPLATFTPFSLSTTNIPMIAPFFADVDTRPTASGKVQFGNTVVDGRTAFCVNYVNVGYFSQQTNRLNTFQVILIDRSDTGPNNFDIEFNYNQMLWETGDASGGSGGLGGNSARSGYANGTATPGTFFELPGSAINGGLLDTNLATGLTNNSFNSPELGRYIFPVREGIVETNTPPVLSGVPISPTIPELAQYSFDANAIDTDSPAQLLTFSLVGAPSGAAIDPASGVFTWTPDETQGPNNYVFTVVVTDNGDPAMSDEQQISIVVTEVNSPPVLGTIANQTGYWGNVFSFTATATDTDIPADVLTFSLVGAAAGASINPSTGAFAWTPAGGQIGSHTFTVVVTDNGSPQMSDSQQVTINVGKRPTAIAYTGDGSEQYSDEQALSATLTDVGGGAMDAMPLSGKLVGFTLGSQGTSDSTDASGVAAANLILTQDPAPAYNVVSNFAGDALYFAATDTDAFDIVQEDARAYYTGSLFVNTACANCGNGTATLAATIKDISAEDSDPAYDIFAGDIRNAKVTFVNRDTNTAISGCSNLSVGLVDLSDPKTGTATCNWAVNIGSADSVDYTIGIIVSNYYMRNSSDENSILTVSRWLGTNFITGGGYLVNALSNGQYAGVLGRKTNFGFNVKYNKSGKNLQGRVNVIVRGLNGRIYQIKGNVMRTLAVRTVSNNPLVKAAVFTGKASMTDITDPLNPIALGGNNTLQLELTDKGEPGNTDTMGITVWNDAGGVLFSSRWDGTRTIEQLLGGGNLVVR